MPDGTSSLASRGQKHHYIPVFYLKQWTGADGRLCEFRRPHKAVKPRMTFPDGTGYDRGLYTFDELEPAVADFLEQKFLLRSDHRAHEVFQLLLTDQLQFDVDRRSRWSRFLMTLIHRSPEGVARLKRAIEDDIPAAMEKLRVEYAESRHEDGKPTFAEYCASLFSGADLQGTMLVAFQRVMNSELLGTALNGMRWAVIRVKHPRYPLLTSDRSLIMPGGLGKPTGHLLMPISPDRVFLAYHSQKTLDLVQRMSDEQQPFAEEINSLIVRQARKYVWGTTDAQLRFVQNRLGEKIKWSPM